MLKQFINGRILTPQGWLEGGSVIVEGNKIKAVANCDLHVEGAETIDAKGYYYAQIQGAMSRLVQFKRDIPHWIFTDNKKDMSKEIMTMNDFQKKFASVT